MDEQERIASKAIVSQIAAKMCPTGKELKAFQRGITCLSDRERAWTEATGDLDPRRTAVFLTDKFRPHIPWYKRRKYAEQIVGNLMFLMEYGYHTFFVEAKSEYGLLTFTLLFKMKTSGLNFALQEFGIAAKKNQWDSFNKKLAFELTLAEYDDFMETRASLAIYPNGLAFNKKILPNSLIELMRENVANGSGKT